MSRDEYIPVTPEPSVRRVSRWPALVSHLRKNPGQWFELPDVPISAVIAARVRRGFPRAFQPAGAFDAAVANGRLRFIYLGEPVQAYDPLGHRGRGHDLRDFADIERWFPETQERPAHWSLFPPEGSTDEIKVKSVPALPAARSIVANPETDADSDDHRAAEYRRCAYHGFDFEADCSWCYRPRETDAPNTMTAEEALKAVKKARKKAAKKGKAS